MRSMLAKISTCSITLVAILSVSGSVFAQDDELGPCEALAIAICEECGDEVCAALLESEEEPTDEECVEVIGALEVMAVELEALSEEEQEAFGIEFCASFLLDDDELEELDELLEE